MDGLVYALVGVLLEVVERVLGDISHRSRIRRIYTEHTQKAGKGTLVAGAQGRRGLLYLPLQGPSSRYVTRTCADASIQISESESYLATLRGRCCCALMHPTTVSLGGWLLSWNAVSTLKMEHY